MVIILTITVAILAIALVGLVIYILRLNKQLSFAQSQVLDKDKDPEFIKIQKDFEWLDREYKREIEQKDKYISDLRDDKKALADNAKNADDFKEISEKSFKEYNSIVQEYRNFHEKLIGNFKYQGAYNEKKLQRLLEKNGLVKDQDFEIREGQKNTDLVTGEAKRVNPDFILKLPDDGSVVIDCKVSLKDFESFANEKNPKQREAHLKKHIDSVRRHIKSLSIKNYTKLYNLKSFKYVVMFLPFDTCYLSCIENDSEIIDFATDQKVIMSGPISINAIIGNITTLKNDHKQLSIVDNIVQDAEKVWEKYKVVRDNIKTLVSSFKTHKRSLENLMNNTYGSKKGLESQVENLRENNGLNPAGTLYKSTEDDKIIGDLDDPDQKEEDEKENVTKIKKIV